MRFLQRKSLTLSARARAELFGWGVSFISGTGLASSRLSILLSDRVVWGITVNRSPLAIGAASFRYL